MMSTQPSARIETPNPREVRGIRNQPSINITGISTRSMRSMRSIRSIRSMGNLMSLKSTRNMRSMRRTLVRRRLLGLVESMMRRRARRRRVEG